MPTLDAPGHVAGFGMTDLLSERLGGKALACSDDCFASMHNLVLAREATFTPESFGSEGQIYSGWESGRNYKRDASHEHDWCVLKLGAPGIVHLLDIDTSFFRGNFPAFAAVLACSTEEDLPGAATVWETILDRSPLKGHAHNLFAVKSTRSWTHLKLAIYPDGGVARLRAYGEVKVDREAIRSKGEVELSSAALGGRGVAASDIFYSPVGNLLWPDKAENMGQGWETARKRGPGHNWAIVALGLPGTVTRIVMDTAHFKHNAPESCEVWGATPGSAVDILSMEAVEWRPIVARTKLAPDTENLLRPDAGAAAGPFSHVKLDIFPDGGVSRLRIFGTVPAA